ncbi:DEAD/DEAH box helicase [Clostridium sporogenes]|uniref:SNF2-related protein n=1 Tax=Clostridium sporogenes TaxID=1509 RepID=UPI001969E334|nr:DEAD/DEAH box helicase [Clostridium sporogenes]MCW6124732.1 DEAD/DEAH box helicase [Clostridium sporogenes]
MKIKLYPHQERALKETKEFNRVGYFLDMGLGKTFVGSEKLKELNTNVNLIICQKSKLQDWCEHFKTYYPEYNTFIYSKTREIPSNSVVIINYDLVWRRPKLSQLENFTLMLDESSMIKNPTSKRTKFILNLKAQNVILLSGTPCGGRYEELHTQCKLLGWNISKKLYWQQYIKFKNIDVGGFKIPKVTGYKNVERLKQKLHEHGSVFMKTEEVFDLPEQVEISVLVENSKEYKKFKKDRLITIDLKNKCEFKDDSDFYGKDVTPRIELVGDTSLTKMLYLRQLASQYNSNKLSALKDLLESTEDRVIIFYNFTEEMEQIKDLCIKLEKPVSIVNGQTKDLSEYNKDTEYHPENAWHSQIDVPIHNKSITLVQYQAGAMGLNLQKSNKIIYYSLPLASELFEQSKKRTHRIGQTRTCMYWYLITKGSIEEQIFETLKERKDFTDKLFEELDQDGQIKMEV